MKEISLKWRTLMKEQYSHFFKEENISYKCYEHAPIYTVEQAKLLQFEEEILEIKNLFLRNKKKNAYYLFSVTAECSLTLQQMSELTGEKKLSFASKEELFAQLKVEPGAVSLLNVLNDDRQAIHYWIEKKILNHPAVGFHPNRNDQTLVFHGEAIPKLMTYCQVKNYQTFDW